MGEKLVISTERMGCLKAEEEHVIPWRGAEDGSWDHEPPGSWGVAVDWVLANSSLLCRLYLAVDGGRSTSLYITFDVVVKPGRCVRVLILRGIS